MSGDTVTSCALTLYSVVVAAILDAFICQVLSAYTIASLWLIHGEVSCCNIYDRCTRCARCQWSCIWAFWFTFHMWTSMNCTVLVGFRLFPNLFHSCFTPMFIICITFMLYLVCWRRTPSAFQAKHLLYMIGTVCPGKELSCTLYLVFNILRATSGLAGYSHVYVDTIWPLCLAV